MGRYSEFLNNVKKKHLPDGTYQCNGFDPEHLESKTFEKGYQVSFMRPDDSYTDSDINDIISKIRTDLGSDVYVGIFGGEPELSFYCASPVVNHVTKFMKKYNQHSIYSWETKGIIRNVQYDQVKDCLKWD